MKKLILSGLVIFTVMLLVVSCERTTKEPTIKGIIAIKSIPVDYGSLVSVTTDSQYSGWTQLWFADTSGTIRMVRVNWMEKTMLEDVMTIPRGGMMEGE